MLKPGLVQSGLLNAEQVREEGKSETYEEVQRGQ